MPLVRGVDISGYQSVTSWPAVAADVDFVIVKATEGTSFVSAVFEAFTRAARAVGLLVGSYHFARPGNPPATEAAHYVSALRSVGWQSGRDLPPILDIEQTAGLNQQALTVWCLRFLREVDSRLGLTDPWLKCGVYCNDDYRRNRFYGDQVLDGRWLHLASWRSSPAWPGEDARPAGAAVWQYTASGIGLVSGISGSGLDLDVARLEDLQNLAPHHYGIEADMPLSDADVEKIWRGIQLRPGPATRAVAGWPADFTGSPELLLTAATAKTAKFDGVLTDILDGVGQLAKPMSDVDRERLAAAIAAKVDSLRVSITHDPAQEDAK